MNECCPKCALTWRENKMRTGCINSSCPCHSPQAPKNNWKDELSEVFFDAYQNADSDFLKPFIRTLILHERETAKEQGALEAAREIGLAAARAGITALKLDDHTSWEEALNRFREAAKAEERSFIFGEMGGRHPIIDIEILRIRSLIEQRSHE